MTLGKRYPAQERKQQNRYEETRFPKDDTIDDSITICDQ